MYAIRNARAYDLYLDSPQIQFNNYLPIWQKMADSMKINEMPSCTIMEKDPDSSLFDKCKL